MSINTSDDDDDEDIRGTRMDSVSSVAIRNLGPEEIDPDDPDQRKLLDQMKNMHANIWGYSDNQPWFLAGLNKTNPSAKRKVIESMVMSTPRGSQENIFPRSTSAHQVKKKSVPNDRNVNFKMSATEILEASKYTDGQNGPRSMAMGDRMAQRGDRPQEMKMIIKKTLELVGDMTKSVQLVYHAVRALARFMTYPTPSLPSDNYIFGHVKGWIWLIYKGLANFQPTCSDALLSILLKRLHKAMSHLAQEAYLCAEDFAKFNADLKKLHESVRKEAKVLKSEGHLWTVRIDGYMKFIDELKLQRNFLVDVREDRAFSSDWVFEPHPSRTGIPRDFFHFQWVRTKKNWANDEFEVRSDYSTRWHPFPGDLSPQLQMELVLCIIEHFTAVMDECRSFIKCNMHLTFDLGEVKCLKFAVAEIQAVKANKESAEFIADLTKRLFEDMALLEEVSQEFMYELDWIVNIIEPCYNTVLKWLRTEPLEALAFPGSRISPNKLCCSCLVKSHEDFLDLYGDPMVAVLLRTPITEEMVQNFFPMENLVNHDLIHLPSSSPINAYGVSEGYVPSLFDKAIGRDPPLVTPKRLPKVRRRSLVHDQGFNIQKLRECTNAVIRPADDKVDTEIYLKIIEQIKKFMQAVGSTLNFMVSEVTERYERLENLLYTELSDYYESLESIVEHEMTGGIIESDPMTCGTRAFRRLHMVFLFFTLFIEELSALEELEGTSYACKTAYYKSYSKYHSWFVQKTSTYSMYAIPIKQILYSKISPDLSLPEVDAIFKQFVVKAKLVYDHCQSVFEEKEIPDL